jgi:phospholipid/cholesterol/gamma-HCH transport system permease protein
VRTISAQTDVPTRGAAKMSAFTLEKGPSTGAVDELRLSGSLELTEGETLWGELRRQLGPSRKVRLDLSKVEKADGACVSLLVALQAESAERGGGLEFAGANEDVRKLLELYGARASQPKAPAKRIGFLTRVGLAARETFGSMRALVSFVGELTIGFVRSLRNPRSFNVADLWGLMERAGADGLPIVALINFLLGLIMGLQSALQLKRFGANIFVADLVGLSMTRELAPLMTAIIVAGRSGAAYAAELGTMKVSEEVDALCTLGLDPQRFLILPRIVALVTMVPLLTLLADLVGCLGGLFIAISMLDLTSVAYVTQLHSALGLWDVFGGLIKAGVFAVMITIVSCQRGLATRGGAAGVGSSTTSAVVTILFSLIALDAMFTWVYALLGI